MIRQMIIFGAAGDLAFQLTLQLVPDRVALTVNSNGPGDPFDLERIELDAELAGQDLPLYGRLLLDILEGHPTFSIRADETEEAWRFVEPIRRLGAGAGTAPRVPGWLGRSQ
jgi:glucose-6-phosphate 1-dehydrogenase